MRIDHICVGVADVPAAADWYERVLGLAPRGRKSGSAFLACGGRQGYDIELREGSGLLNVGYRVRGDELDGVRESLTRAGASPRAIQDGIGVTMANGIEVRLERAGGEDAYGHATEWDSAGAGSPRQLDHVTVAATDLPTMVKVATEGLGLQVSDIQRYNGRDVGLWLRAGERHHDFAVVSHRKDGLHHLAYQVVDAADLVRLADRIVRLGHRSEYGIGRHGPGSNLFLYVRDPSGNRVELCCDMAVVPPGAPARIWEGNDDRYLDVWAPYLPPASWLEIT
ncbi:MAG: VOC family protein [Actinomycetota bacterium]|nr:VOC family protein [Actinomycetota bacterium]